MINTNTLGFKTHKASDMPSKPHQPLFLIFRKDILDRIFQCWKIISNLVQQVNFPSSW